MPKARVWASQSEWHRLGPLLYQRNIVRVVEEKDISKHNGELVLQGMFQVTKPGDATNKRLVMKLLINQHIAVTKVFFKNAFDL